MIILPLSYLFTVKKEEVWKVLNAQRKEAAFILIITSIVLGIMRYSIVPKLILLYQNLGVRFPTAISLLSWLLPLLLIVSFTAGLYFWFAKPSYSRVEAIASKYPDSSLIRTRELIDLRLVFFPILFSLITICYTAFVLINAVYTMSNQL